MSTGSAFNASGTALNVTVPSRFFFSGVEWMGSVDAVFGIFVEGKVAAARKSDRQCQPLTIVPCRLPTPLNDSWSRRRGQGQGGERTLRYRREQRVAELVCS